MSNALENLERASAWIKSFANPDHVSHIGLYGEMPTVYFIEFKKFQEAFGGKPCKITIGQYARTYHVVIQEIDFWATEYNSSGPPPDVQLTGFVPHIVTS